MEILSIVTQSLSALLLIMVGMLRLADPIKNYAKNSGITFPGDVDVLNEMRAVGAVMMSAGFILVLGIFFDQMTMTSFVVGSLIFIGFLIGRSFGMVKDGKPNKQIIQGMVFELIFGALNVVCLFYNLV